MKQYLLLFILCVILGGCRTSVSSKPKDEADLGTFPQLSQTEGLYLDGARPRELAQLARGTSQGKRVAFSVSAIGFISKERFFEEDSQWQEREGNHIAMYSIDLRPEDQKRYECDALVLCWYKVLLTYDKEA